VDILKNSKCSKDILEILENGVCVHRQTPKKKILITPPKVWKWISAMPKIAGTTGKEKEKEFVLIDERRVRIYRFTNCCEKEYLSK